MLKRMLENLLELLLPPKFPKIRSKVELWESWLKYETPSFADQLDPQTPLRKWEHGAWGTEIHSPIPKMRKYFDDESQPVTPRLGNEPKLQKKERIRVCDV